MGKLDTFSENELQLTVTGHWDFLLPNLVFKFKAAVGWNNGVGPEGVGRVNAKKKYVKNF